MGFFSISIGAYGFLYLNEETGSVLEYFPVFGFSSIFFVSCLGLRTIPNLLTSEIFPYRFACILLFIIILKIILIY